MPIKRDKPRSAFGRIDPGAMVQIDRCLAIIFGTMK